MENTLLKLFLLNLIIYSCSDDASENGIFGEGVFTTKSESALIEGELFLPNGTGIFPLTIIVDGSGNETRDELRPFADIFNSAGYALYISDKRGIGGSTGSYPLETPTTETEFLTARAQDVLGIIELLKTHIQIDANRMGVFGASQGAWVTSIVYSQYPDLSYIINASGSVTSTGVADYYDLLTDDPNLSIEDATNQLYDYDGVIGFDPINIINNMTLPVLWVAGNEDRSHPTRYDADIIEGLNKINFTHSLFANTTHELIDTTTGDIHSDIFPTVFSWLDANN